MDFFPKETTPAYKNHQGTSDEEIPCWGGQTHETLSQKTSYPFKNLIELTPAISEKLSIKQPLSLSLNSRELIVAENLLVISHGNGII